MAINKESCDCNGMQRCARMGSGSRRSVELARQQRAVTKKVNAVYRRFKQATNGADGATGLAGRDGAAI